MAEEITDPKKCLVAALDEMSEVTGIMINLDENHVKLADVELMQKKLSRAASEMTKLRAYMIEHLPTPPKETSNNDY